MRYLRNAHGRALQSHEMMAALGFKPTSPLPKDYEGTHEVDGIQVHVLPSKGGRHRIFYSCTCDRLVPFGRITQHLRRRGHP